MKHLYLRSGLWASPVAVLINFITVYIVYEICRAAFLLENWSVYAPHLDALRLKDVAEGTFLFNASAIFYTNALYALFMLFPFHHKERAGWQRFTKWLFVAMNGLCVVLNLSDAVYVKYTGRRTTVTAFREFSHEGSNLGKIMLTEFVAHWYLLVLGIGLIWLLWRVYVQPRNRMEDLVPKWRYYLTHTVVLAAYAFVSVCGMRGGYATSVRPITLSNANQYVNRPMEANLILNTPFAIIRTIDKKPFVTPHYFDRATLDKLYSPLHRPTVGGEMHRKNVVVLIVESMGKEYLGAFNGHLDGGSYKGYTPFLDSLSRHCLTFRHTFATGRKSIDGMPSVLSSIPMFVEPFFVTSAALNKISGLAGELNTKGYHTAFFHGADNGSMGFQSFARTTGFKAYYGRTEYNADRRFGGDKDFDGTWSIWDEEFLQFYALKMSEFKEPFMTSLFTASSHHPFVVPERYQASFPEEGGHPLHKCVRYTDMSLRKFFETASRCSWYRNTLFVITADHTNHPSHDEYRSVPGLYSVPILFYDPSGELIRPGVRNGIAKQIDIMPTLLGFLGYDKPYVAFGSDLSRTRDEDTWSVGYANGLYFFIQGNHILFFDGRHTTAVHNFVTDPLGRKNLKGKMPRQADMEQRLKAIIQSYMERMNGDHLTAQTS